jgi:hypothetical protein
MALVNAARDLIVTALAGGAFTPFAAATAHIGVGDSSAAFAATQTDLQGANKFRRPQETTFPTIAPPVLTYRSLFSTGEANFPWFEWGVFNAAAGGTMLNRKIESLGTKNSAQSWQFTVQLTFGVA